MTRRKLLCLSLPVALLLVLGAAWWGTWPPESPVTYGNYQRIREGMTPEEVEAILGEASGWYDIVTGLPLEPSAATAEHRDWVQYVWREPAGQAVCVAYDESGRVKSRGYSVTRQARPLLPPWGAPIRKTYSDRPPTFSEMVSAGDWPF